MRSAAETLRTGNAAWLARRLMRERAKSAWVPPARGCSISGSDERSSARLSCSLRPMLARPKNSDSTITAADSGHTASEAMRRPTVSERRRMGVRAVTAATVV